MRKLLVATVDLLLLIIFICLLVVLNSGFPVIGGIIALLSVATIGGFWSAISLIFENTEKTKNESKKQTEILSSIHRQLVLINESNQEKISDSNINSMVENNKKKSDMTTTVLSET